MGSGGGHGGRIALQGEQASPPSQVFIPDWTPKAAVHMSQIHSLKHPGAVDSVSVSVLKFLLQRLRGLVLLYPVAGT